MNCNTGRRVKDIIDEMETKAKDASKEATQVKMMRNVWRKKYEESGMRSKVRIQRMIQKFKSEADLLRDGLKKKNAESIEFKVRKWSVEFWL